ncbi:AAA family ATPase, partial [Leuconostoc mesenteroides]|uniref:AAA family ATPase n=1 Tax=Leuconostoc mesenteroides TaxID=1245 RepID=UPI00236125B9
MTVTNIKAFIGSPGTGKSYRLVRMANELLKQGESVHIMNPTRSARNNLRKAFKEMLVSDEMTQEDYKQTYIITNVLHGYKETLAKHIFIDESAMIDLDVFYSLLYATL